MLPASAISGDSSVATEPSGESPGDWRGDAPAVSAPGVGADTGKSGIRLLHDGKDAFAARVMLIRSARDCLDVQYYIWHGDLSGSLMLDEIVAAADRGVGVRLLLDDNGIAGLDARLCEVAAHDNVDVRLYNPFPLRWPKALGWLFAFARLNHRMHAKSLTVDRHCTIVGGRNIGDEYFGAKRKGLFEDLDAIAIGPVVGEVVQVFEQHWHGANARSTSRILASVSRHARRKAARRAATLRGSKVAEHYRRAIEALPLVYDMSDGSLDFTWAPARAIGTFPDTSIPPAARHSGLAELLPAGMGTPDSELIVISGYFVPTADGSADLATLARGGVRVRVLTNSFAATDVAAVHAGYAPRRRALLASGAALHEMPAPDDKPKTARKFIGPGSKRSRAQSGRSLHAKVYIADRRRVYIGSANFDPRSAHINTELGFVIESPALAENMAEAFETAAANSYRLALGSGGVTWCDERDDQPTPEATEPGANALTRLLTALLSRLPIEHLL